MSYTKEPGFIKKGGCRHAAFTAQSGDGKKAEINFITDMEGSALHFENALKKIAGIEVVDTPEKFDVSFKPEDKHTLLILGGDWGDLDTADLKVLNTVLALINKYPHRVINIIGNRDWNKLRFGFELSPAACKSHAFRLAIVEKNNKYHAAEAQVSPEAFTKEFVKEDATEEDAMIGMAKYMLAKTMNAPHAFAYRKAELRGLGRAHEDIDVARSFYHNSIVHNRKMGALLELLTLSYVAVIVDNKFYTHGAITKHNWGLIPSSFVEKEEHLKSFRSKSPYEWVDALHDKLKQVLFDYRYLTQNPDEITIEDYNKLDWIGFKDWCIAATNGLMASKFKEDGKVGFTPVDPEVAEWLIKHAGVTCIIVGHSPQNDVVSVFKTMTPAGMIIVVMGDTQYSGFEEFSIDGQKYTRTRSSKVSSCITITEDNIVVEGTNKDGLEYKADVADKWIGLVADIGEKQWIISHKLRENETRDELTYYRSHSIPFGFERVPIRYRTRSHWGPFEEALLKNEQ